MAPFYVIHIIFVNSDLYLNKAGYYTPYLFHFWKKIQRQLFWINQLHGFLCPVLPKQNQLVWHGMISK